MIFLLNLDNFFCHSLHKFSRKLWFALDTLPWINAPSSPQMAVRVLLVRLLSLTLVYPLIRIGVVNPDGSLEKKISLNTYYYVVAEELF